MHMRPRGSFRSEEEEEEEEEEQQQQQQQEQEKKQSRVKHPRRDLFERTPKEHPKRERGAVVLRGRREKGTGGGAGGGGQ